MIHKNEGNTLEIEREEEMREELRYLICNFAIIDGEVQNELDKKLKKNKRILTKMKRNLRPLVNVNLIEVRNVDELFYELYPYYDFLDCEVIKKSINIECISCINIY